MQISNSHVLITGANRGIGLGLAKMFAQEKSHLHLVVRQQDSKLEDELKNIGALSVTTWITDLNSKESIQRLLLQLESVRIDILINNAGQLTGGLIEEQNLEEIYSMFQVNVLALIQLTRGLIPKMLKQKNGKIINNSSVSGIMHFPCASTYAASKAAVIAFTNCIQAELENTGVSTLCLITPGIKTRMFDEIAIKYGKNFEIPTESISTDDYANKIKQAILDDKTYLEPSGVTGIGLMVARYLPGLFRRETNHRFKRK